MINKLSQFWAIFTLITLTQAINASEEVDGLNFIAVKAPHSLLMDIKKIHKDRLVAVGQRGHILISDDNGQNWRQVQVPTEVLLTKLFFISPKTGWAVGHQQVILKTSDGGDSWTMQNQSDDLAQPALFDLWFSNANNGMAVGAYGLFLSTDDGGESWLPVIHDSLYDDEIGFSHFYSLVLENKSKNLFLAGELGLLAVSKDFGASWQKLDTPYRGTFFHIDALKNGDLFVMGLRGHLYRSNDSGESWQEINTHTISGLQNLIQTRDGQKLIIVGSNGTQLISDNNGESFQLTQRSDRVHLAAGVESADNKLLLVGVNGVIQSAID